MEKFSFFQKKRSIGREDYPKEGGAVGGGLGQFTDLRGGGLGAWKA